MSGWRRIIGAILGTTTDLPVNLAANASQYHNLISKDFPATSIETKQANATCPSPNQYDVTPT